MYCQEDVVLIILAIEQCLQSEWLELLIKLINLLSNLAAERLIILALIKLHQLFNVIDFANKLLPWIITILERIKLLESLLSGGTVIPEIWSSCLLLNFFYLILSPSLFKDASIQCRLLL